MGARIEISCEELQRSLDALRQARLSYWPATLDALSEMQARVVYARAMKARSDADLRDRAQVPVSCTLPDGRHYTACVLGAPTNQLVLSPEFKAQP